MKKNKIISMFLAVSLALTPLTPQAETSNTHFPITYTSESGNYTATKLSHPNDDVMQPDGIIEYENGINDRGENYSWSAVGHGDYIYVGVLYGAISRTLQIMAAQNNIDYSLFKASIDALFNGTLFMGDEENNPNNENRSMLLKLNTKTGEVTVVRPPSDASYRAAIEYKGKLYFAASASQPYLLEVDPTDDSTKIVYTSQKPSNPFISVGIRGLTVVNDNLVASMIGDNGAYIVSSNNPSEGESSFKTIATQQDLLDYPAYYYNDSIFGGAIWDMVEFNNKLYVTVVTGKSGNKQAFAMFSGEENKETGKWDFNLIVGDEKDGAAYPYGLGADRSGAGNLFVYDNHLYIGGYNDPMIALADVLNMNFEELYKDLSSPVCLWRMDTDENINMVAGDSNELFPTVLGNQSAGFGSNLNQYVWRMAEYDNKLYVGTFDIGSLAYPLMQFTNGDVLHMTPEEIKSQIHYIKVLLEVLKKNDEDATITESTDANTKSNYSEEAKYINSLSAEDQNDVENSLTELYDGLSELESVLDLEAYSETETCGLSDSLLNIYQNLVNEYLKIRDLLPEDLVEILDKTLNQDSVDNLFYFLETCKYLSAGERGFDLLVSEDGINFETITTNGLGDPYNHGCRIFAVTNSGLTLGTANPFYGTQVWKVTDNQRGTILDSIIKNTDVTYNKNPEASENKNVSFDVDFNGNTLKTIQLNYNTLKEGTDYTVSDNQIILSETLLNSLEVGTYSLSFTFSAGSRANAVLHVIDEANSNNSDDNSGTDSDDVIKPTNPTNPNTDSNGSNTNKLPQTGALVSSTVIVFIGLILLCAGTLLLKKKSKYNAQ
ncbi:MULTISPECIES: X2-like carbohydrate binding domain-containing protein [Clostridium]|uniref:LPXTG cell wall anchor domain-containing protein n=1 Tax=Clostridium saudiense TaxID=1414720 RepID=A0ABS2FGJ8_9CLOT|nr:MULTISPECIES: X2-like carbohydrate binding domain-containing protein [Clostridium]MBM6819063.1 LPXTG cell wall anchor domain-containing protein [Clostridium saudiense]